MVWVEIFLIWANVALINVTMTVGICYGWSQEPSVKIGAVTTEIFLIWTNVSRTNFALTNVTVTVGIC